MAGEESSLVEEKEELQAKLEGSLVSWKEEVVADLIGLAIRQLAGEEGGGVVNQAGVDVAGELLGEEEEL